MNCSRQLAKYAAVVSLFLALLGLGAAEPVPIGHWAFDEADGQQVYDISGNEHHGVRGLHGGEEDADPSWVEGRHCSSLCFKQANDEVVRVPHDEQLAPNTLTMAAWVRPHDRGDDYQIVMAKEQSYKLAVGPDGSLRASMYNNKKGWMGTDQGGWMIADDISIPVDEWTHVAVTFDGKYYRFYVDGELEHTQKFRKTAYSVSDNGADLGIGARDVTGTDAAPRKHFEGYIDDVRLYGDVLDESEVQAAMDGPESCPADDDGSHDHDDGSDDGSDGDTDGGKTVIHNTYSYDITKNTHNTYNNQTYVHNNQTYIYNNQTYKNVTNIHRDLFTVEKHTYVYYFFGDGCPDGCRQICESGDCPDYGDTPDGGTTPVDGTVQNVDIEIREASYPARIAAGQEIAFEVTVDNRGLAAADSVKLFTNAYGQRKEAAEIQLGAGEQRTVTVPFTVPLSASGPEDVQIEARAEDVDGRLMERDLKTVRINVDDLRATLRVDPQEVVVGDTVEIYGQLNAPDVPAKLFVDGLYVTTVVSDETSRFSHSVVADEPGTFPVELRAGNVRRTEYLRVRPQLDIRDVDIPETANTRDTFRSCVTVTTATQGEVTLTMQVGDRVVNRDTVTVNGEQRHCFESHIRHPGMHTITFTADRNGEQTTVTHEMQVVESQVEVNVFPQQLTVERGTAGVFQVALKNQDAHGRTFEIDVQGLDRMAETTHRTVSLGPQEDRTVFVRVRPQEKGIHEGRIRVTANDITFADTAVEVFATTNPLMRERPGVVDRARERIGATGSYVADRARGIVTAIVVLLLLGGVLLAVYKRKQENGVMEPRY